MFETNFYGTVIEHDEDVVQERFTPTSKTSKTFTSEGRCEGRSEGLEPHLEQTPTILPPEPPPVGQGPPSWRHITVEQQLLSRHILDISGNNGWWSGTGEKNQDAPRRRLYAMNDSRQCERCAGASVPWLDTHLLVAGRYCVKCHTDVCIGSYLHYELNRTPQNSVESDSQEFVADDPKICDLPFWEPGMMVHLGAAMRTGKTWFACDRAEADTDALYLLMFPRRTLAYNVWNSRRRLGWGLFYGGSDKRYRTIGEHGVMLTLPSLPFVLQQIKRKFGDDIPPINIFLDEIDFCADLMFANILRGASPEIRGLLRQIVAKHGIVTAGQTEMTATLECVAAELGIDPEQNLYAYYNHAPPANETAELLEYPDGEGKKNRLIAGVVEAVERGIQEGKRVYVHADGRRTAQVIASFDKGSLLLDRYHRGIKRNQELFYRGRLDDDTRVFVSSNALDVGVSFRDKNAETHVVQSENPLRFGSPQGTGQKNLRNRELPPVYCHFTRFNNSLPISPSEAANRAEFRERMKLGEDEQLPKHLVRHHATRESLKTLSDNQTGTFISHHLQRAGYEVKVQQTPPQPQEMTVNRVKDRKKQLRDAEGSAVKQRAIDILDTIEVMSDSEIQQAGEQGRLEPIPTEQLAHEEVNAALSATGWDGVVERKGDDGLPLPTTAVFADVKPEQWQCANTLLQEGVDTGKLAKQRRGFLGVHFPMVNDALAQQDRDDGQLEFIHRRNDGLMTALLTALLMFSPQNAPQTLNEVTPSIHQAFMVEYQGYPLAHWIARGALGDANGLRFLNWGPDAEITVHHLKWIQRFIREYYPARLRIETWTVEKIEQVVCLLVQSDDAPVVVDAIRCYLTHAHPEVNLDSAGEHLSLFPTQGEMPYQHEAEREQARQMRTAGASVDDIAKEVEKSTGWVAKHTGDITANEKRVKQQQAMELHEQQGKTAWAIAKELGVANHTVKRWLNVC